jgi:Protein of unknown function (DUF3500)
MRVRMPILGAVVAVIAAAAIRVGVSQDRDPLAGLSEQQKRSLAEPFKGVTTDGRVIGGLYAIEKTGLSTEPVRTAAEAFLAGLTAAQRERASFPVDDREWRMWINTPQPARQGVSFEEMSDAQRALAFGLVRASLSARGAEKAENVMKLNGTLAELRGLGRGALFGEWKYWITVMGTPSSTEPWGWQLDGHHCVINYFVLGDQVVMTPTFFGSEPVRATEGRFAGTVVLQEEQDEGLALFTSLGPMQRAVATLRTTKGADSVAAAYADNLVLDYAGIRAADLDDGQREQLLELIAEYVNDEPVGQARLRMADIAAHFDDTYFAWIGTDDPAGVFYYRIQSPVVLIEFDHQNSVLPGGARGASRNHIHTVIRTPNGNDYGKDLLRQHYARDSHAAAD